MKNHVVIVGGSKGLGRVVAENFLTRGFLVTVLSRTRPSFNDNIHHIFVDLNKVKDANELAATVANYNSKLRYLIFCQRYRGEEEDWDGEIQVSLTSTKLLIDAFESYFEISEDCAIGIVSSVYANFVGGSQPASYHVAKAGLNQLVKFNAWVLGKKGIRINAIMPLTYLKEESKNFYLNDQRLLSLYKDLIPLRKMGSANDSANLLSFLCSENASFINGQAIYVDGGVSVIWPEELAKQLSIKD
ncbi:MAG: SDR family oxidoreductase [Rickettsiaceae bacterium]|nr:SDR family oxidoreductase [Rickettsiaceae bacterium]